MKGTSVTSIISQYWNISSSIPASMQGSSWSLLLVLDMFSRVQKEESMAGVGHYK